MQVKKVKLKPQKYFGYFDDYIPKGKIEPLKPIMVKFEREKEEKVKPRKKKPRLPRK